MGYKDVYNSYNNKNMKIKKGKLKKYGYWYYGPN